MKSLIFDTGPLISLTMNNLLWILEPLKKQFKGQFYITENVRREVIDKPMRTKRFKFESLQISRMIDEGTLQIIRSEDIRKKSFSLLDLANNSFKCKGRWLRIVHLAEIESLAASIALNSDAYVVDERTMRMIVENPPAMKEILKRKLHCNVEVNRENISRLKEEVGNIKMFRSVELLMVAYEMGLLEKYLPKTKDARKILLDAVLWGAKLDGCAVSGKEIDKIIDIESRR